VFARHGTDLWKPSEQPGEPHVHFLIGNVPYADLRREVDRWPGAAVSGGRDIRKVCNRNGGRWGALHYLFAQTDNKFKHAQDVFSYCHDLLEPPFESDNLEAWLLLTRRQIQATAARDAVYGKPGSWTVERARQAATTRWDKYREAKHRLVVLLAGAFLLAGQPIPLCKNRRTT